jgi:hypothetical protein
MCPTNPQSSPIVIRYPSPNPNHPKHPKYSHPHPHPHLEARAGAANQNREEKKTHPDLLLAHTPLHQHPYHLLTPGLTVLSDPFPPLEVTLRLLPLRLTNGLDTAASKDRKALLHLVLLVLQLVDGFPECRSRGCCAERRQLRGFGLQERLGRWDGFAQVADLRV